MVPIALQLYSVREELGKDWEGTLRAVKAMGYDGVEFAGLGGQCPGDLKRLLAGLGLVPMGAHVPFTDMMAGPGKVLGEYATVGCSYVAIPYLTEDYRPGAAKFDEVLAGAKLLGQEARKLGMTLLYHNHDFEFAKLEGKYALDVLYDAVPADLLQTEIDTCWVKVAGEDPAAYVRKYAGRAPVVHLKDFYKSGDAGDMYELIGLAQEKKAGAGVFEFRPLGSGQQDFPAILAAAQDAGAKWLVVEQDTPTPGKTALTCAEMSIQYLKGLK